MDIFGETLEEIPSRLTPDEIGTDVNPGRNQVLDLVGPLPLFSVTIDTSFDDDDTSTSNLAFDHRSLDDSVDPRSFDADTNGG